MARQIFGLTGLLVVLMAAGRVGTHADSTPDGPIIPMPLAQVTTVPVDLVSKTVVQEGGTTSSVPTESTGQIVSSLAMPGTAFRVMYLFQHDTGKPGDPLTDGKPISVILWKALEVGANAPVRGVMERISENSASISMTSKAVYLLLPDYKVQKLTLLAQDIDHTFALLKAGDGEAIAADTIWKSKIAKELKEVEWLDDGTHKMKKRVKDKQGKEKSVKQLKNGRPGKSVAKSTKVAANVSASKGKSAKRQTRS